MAKSINLFASLVETRCLLGKDVTIADLNHIKNKEGLSLASVIQPTPLISLKPAMSSQYNGQSGTNNNASNNNCNPSHQSSSNNLSSSPKSTNNSNVHETNITTSTHSSSSSSQRNNNNNNKNNSISNDPVNQHMAHNSSLFSANFNVNPFIKALSHFISLHHPGHQETGCKKNQIETSLASADNNTTNSLGTLRPPTTTSSNMLLPKETKVSRSRASKQASLSREALDAKNVEDFSSNALSQDWTREEIELFAKALEICGKNFGAIKKEFLPSKSVRSIVEYYYIGTREYLDSKRKTQQSIVEPDACSSPEKQQTYNGQGGDGGDGSTGSGGGGGSTTGSSSTTNNTTSNGITNSSSNNSTTNNKTNNNADDQRSKTKSASDVKVETLKSEEQQSTPIVPKLTSTSDSKLENRNSTKTKKSPTPEDSRMSVYTFEDCKEDDVANISVKQSMRSSKSSPGAEVRPLRAKPILPNNSIDADPSLSNVGSLKFYMDGQLVLKLNACQDQMKGIEKCHWVQSEEQSCKSNKMRLNKKRLKKHEQNNQYRNEESNMSTDQQNSNSGTSYQGEDYKNETSGDEDSKESEDSMNSQKHPNPSNNDAYPAKKPKIKLESVQPPQIDYHNQAMNVSTAQQSPTLNSNHGHQPWSSQGLAAAAALFISQNAAALAVQHQQQSMKNENYDNPSNFMRSQADLMLLNRYSASQMPSLPSNEFAEYERAIRGARAVSTNSQVSNNRSIRSSPSSMSSTSTLENIGGCHRPDSIGYPPMNLQQPPRAHSTSSSTSTSSSSASTLPMASAVPSVGYGLSVTPSSSPATSDTVTAYTAASMNRGYTTIGSSPVDLSVDTDCDTDMSVDLTMTPKKKSQSKKMRSTLKSSSSAVSKESPTNPPRYDYHV